VNDLMVVGIFSSMVSLLLMPLAIKLSFLVGAVDRPDSRKVHSKAMPRLGGLSIVGSLLITLTWFVEITPAIQGVLAGLIVVFLTGLADDVWQISPKLKLIGEIIGVSLFVWISGASLTNLGNIFGFGVIETGWLAIPLTIVAMVGVINALNLSDGLDGLASGLATIALLFFGFFAFKAGYEDCFLITITLFFALIGFLFHNHHPAKIFMGDSGSLSLGFLLAALAVLLVQSGDTIIRPVSPVSMALILAVPIMDTLLVMGRRIAHGESPFLPDKTHLHHRLLNIGIPHPGVVGVLYAVMIAMGIFSVEFRLQPDWAQLLLGLTGLSLVYGMIVAQQRAGLKVTVKWEPRQGKDDGKGIYSKLTELSGKSIPVVTWLIPLFFVPLVLLVDPPSGKLLGSTVLVVIFCLMLYPWGSSAERTGWCHGIFYLLCFVLFLALNVSAHGWVPDYLKYGTLLLLLWVIFKLAFKRHGRIFLTSGFEIMVITMVAILPWLAEQVEMIPVEFLGLYLSVAVESFVWLFALKIIIRRQPHRNTVLMLCFSGLLIILTSRGLLG